MISLHHVPVRTLKVELRNVRYAEFASQETYCFSADVYLDGKKAIHAANDGHGGMTALDDIAPESKKALEAYCATLPPLENKWGRPLAVDAELLVNELMSEWLIRRDMVRALKARIIYTLKAEPGVLYWMKPPATPIKLVISAQVIEGFKRFMISKGRMLEHVLNEMSTDEAFTVWREHARKQEAALAAKAQKGGHAHG